MVLLRTSFPSLRLSIATPLALGFSARTLAIPTLRHLKASSLFRSRQVATSSAAAAVVPAAATSNQ